MSLSSEIAPGWSTLGEFAKGFPRRNAGELPHSVREHLLQRIGETQRGNRPPVRAQRRSGNDILVEVVTEANYQAVVHECDGLWSRMAPEQAAEFRIFAGKQPAKLPDGSRQADFDADALSRHLRLEVTPEDNEKISDVDVKRRVDQVWKSIWETVEGSVLGLVGPPNTLCVVSHGDERLNGARALYDPKTQTIYIEIIQTGGADWNINAGRLRHEFGHHVEEQGPLEVWIFAAEILQRLGRDELLAAPRSAETREPGYGVRLEDLDHEGKKIPNAAYACSYYPDAGTELLSLGLEDDFPGNMASYAKSYDADFLLLQLLAFRPSTYRRSRFAVPTLLR